MEPISSIQEKLHDEIFFSQVLFQVSQAAIQASVKNYFHRWRDSQRLLNFSYLGGTANRTGCLCGTHAEAGMSSDGGALSSP